MGLKTEWTEFECFIWNVLLRHYINAFIQIVNWNNLNETFQAYRKNYLIVTKEKKVFFLWLWLFRWYRMLIKILANGCCQKKGYEFVYLQLEEES